MRWVQFAKPHDVDVSLPEETSMDLDVWPLNQSL